MATRVRAERPEVHLVMAGDLTSALQAQAARLGLGEALHVLPRVAREDMATLYTTASVLLFPSLYEGFGLPVLEAQMCRTPVVCSERRSLPETILIGDLVGVANCTDEIIANVSRSLSSQGNHETAAPKVFGVSDWMVSHLRVYCKQLDCGANGSGKLAECPEVTRTEAQGE